MCDGHLRQISKLRIELTGIDIHPVYSAPYQTGPTMQHFAATEIDRMLRKEVIETVTTESTSTIVFAPRKDRPLRFCVDYHQSHAVIFRDSYPLQRMDNRF